MEKEPFEEESYPVLAELEAAARRLKAMPDSPERRAKQQKLQKAFNVIVQNIDLPAQVLSPESPLIRALEFVPGVSYAPGLVRTAVGEGYLAAKGKSAGALERLKNALVPDVPLVGEGAFNKPALSFAEYRELGGSTGGAWDKKLLPENNYLNPSVGSMVDFLGGAALDPAILKGGYKALTKKSAPKTLEEAQNRLAEELAKAKASQNPSFKQGVLNVGKNIVNTAIDPFGTVGTGLENLRFNDADYAAILSGRRKISDIWREGGKPGWTNKSLKTGFGKIEQKAQENINDVIKTLPKGRELIDLAKSRYASTHGLDAANAIQWENVPNKILEEVAFKQSRGKLLSVLDTPELRMKENLGPYAESIPEARANILSDYTAEQMNQPGFAEDYADYVKSTKPNTISVPVGEGAQTVEVPFGRRPAPAKTPLEVGTRSYTPEELNLIAQREQQEAKRLNDVYNTPDPATEKLNKTERKGSARVNKDEASMRADLGAKARELQHESVAAINPESGVKSLTNTADLASIYQAGPYVYEPFDPSGNRGIRLKGNVLGSATLDALQGLGDVAALGVGKVLTNPYVRYGVQPALRSSIAEKRGQKAVDSPWHTLQTDYMDENGPYQLNPEQIKKYMESK